MIQYAALWFLARVAGRLPVRVLYALADAAGTAAWYASRRVRETTADHMRHVLGPGAPRGRVEALARSCARSAARYYADFARTAVADPAPLEATVESIEGMEHLAAAFAQGRGVIVVSAHLGSPELLGRVSAALPYRIAVVTEPLSPPRVHDLLHEVRERHGVPFIPLDRAGMRRMVAHLHAGGTLAILGDRDVHGTAPLVPFFQERAPIPTGPVELARRGDVPTVAMWVPRVAPERVRVVIEPLPLPPATGDREADIASGVTAMVAALEEGIRRWPGQWFPLTPIWGGRADTGERRP